VKPEGTVGSILTKDVVTVDSSETLRTALKKMLKENVGSLPVMENGKAVGIITERDVARICTETDDPSRCFETKTGSVMKTPLVAVNPEMPVLDALELMLDKSIRRLPVMRDGRLVGIITERDIVVWVLKETYKPLIPEHLRRFVDKINRLEKL
jgi:CBS domain-containing protein